MEFNLKKTSVGELSTVLDTVSEQPVDIDFTLPDYCPDIEKILRCKITPKIYNKNLSGGQLQLDGTTVVTVLYVDAQNNTIRACEQSLPFSASFSLKDLPEQYIVDAFTKCEYVNCRALSKRRLTVHGAFSLYARVRAKSLIELCSPDDDDSLEYNTKDIRCASLTSLGQEQFSAGDELKITGKPPVEIILDSDVRACITDYKVIPDRLMLNGELNVRILYLSSPDSATPEQIDCLIPFNKILECDGLGEDSTVCVDVSLMSFDIRLKSDILSEDPVVDVDSRLCATVVGYTSVTVPIVLDAFSTEYVVELENSQLTLPEEICVLQDSFMQKETLSFDDAPIAEIVDFRCEHTSLNPILNGSEITLNSKLNICILAKDSDNQPLYLERSVEFSKQLETEIDCNNILSVNSCVASLSYRLSDNNTIELRAEIKYCVTASKTTNCTMVTAICANEENRVNKKSCALTLYYAEAGEKLWDIAKTYSTRQKMICEENGLECEELIGPTMLLIPTI